MKNPTEIFKALSDETRLRIMRLLISSGKELCCCEMTDSLEEPQYNVSRHLKILKQAGLAGDRKEKRWVYSFAVPASDEFIKHLYSTISALGGGRFSEDKKNLEDRLGMRVDGKCKLGIQKTHITGRQKATT